MTVHKKAASQNIIKLNTEIVRKFLVNQNNIDVRKTHLFEGRYENIYLTDQHIPELQLLIKEAIYLAQDILNVTNLRAGYWFNYMPPDSVTFIHNHDDYDELLSAVYYVQVPVDSGNLIIYDTTEDKDEEKIIIEPHVGEFIFFNSDRNHEVTKNKSSENRLSIGINFGLSK